MAGNVSSSSSSNGCSTPYVRMPSDDGINHDSVGRLNSYVRMPSDDGINHNPSSSSASQGRTIRHATLRERMTERIADTTIFENVMAAGAVVNCGVSTAVMVFGGPAGMVVGGCANVVNGAAFSVWVGKASLKRRSIREGSWMSMRPSDGAIGMVPRVQPEDSTQVTAPALDNAKRWNFRRPR